MKIISESTLEEVLVNGISYDLAGGSSLFLIAPADKPNVKGIHVALRLPPRAFVELPSLEFRAIGSSVQFSETLSEDNVSGLEQAALTQLISSRFISNQTQKQLRIGLSLFASVDLPNRFVLQVPVQSVGGFQKASEFCYVFSEERHGYMLVQG